MEDGGGGRSRRYEFSGETNASTAGLTLGGILSIKQTPPYPIHDRTLLDLIRDDQTCGKESKKTWRMFREKFRLKLAGSVCTTTMPTLASHVHITTDSNRGTTRNGNTPRNSTGESTLRVNSPLVSNSNTSSSVPDTQTAVVETEPPVEEREQTATREEQSASGEREPAAVRMSLMSLLEVEGSGYFDEEEEDDEEEVEEVAVEEGGGGGGGYKYNNCCVCMVRHKGAAFIPCGHTFCRLCSRELFVKRASCPLCNNFILEILDIF